MATGVVSLQAPPKVKVKAHKDATFSVKLTLKGSKLPGNYINSGSMGASGDALTLNEYDGYLMLDDGRQVTWSVDLATSGASAFFYTEYATNTGNPVLYICAEQVGLTGTDMLAIPVDVTVIAEDVFYEGPGDEMAGLTVTPPSERYYAIPQDIPAKSDGTMTVYDFGPWPGNSSELA